MNRFIKLLKLEFAGYSKQTLMGDLFSGFTVTAVALPLALAFGVSCGASASAGIITAIFAGLIIGGLGGSSYQISGPTGAMVAVLMPISVQYGIEGLLIAGFLSGVFIIIAAFLKLGRIVNIIPMPVIVGFTSGIAVTIFIDQLDDFFGTTLDSGFNPQIEPVLIGLLVIIIMVIWPKKWNAILPSSLVSIIIATLVTWVFHFNVELLGDIPRTLIAEDRLQISFLTLENIKPLILPAISIAALGMIETLLCASAGERMKNEKFDSQIELYAQGIGNMAIPFFGGVPATAAIARTSVAIKSGSRTRLTSIFHSCGLIITVLLLAPVMSQIPSAALGGVLMVTAWRMNEWESIRKIFSGKFSSAIVKFSLTMGATIFFDLTIAIAIGVLASIIIFFIKSSDVEVFVSDIDCEKLKLSKEDNINESILKKMKVIYISGPLFFGSSQKLINTISALSDDEIVILSMRGVPMSDMSAATLLLEHIEQMNKKGKTFALAGLQPKVDKMFQHVEMTNHVKPEHFYWSADVAIREFAKNKST